MDLVIEKRGRLGKYWEDPLFLACECWADIALQKCRGKEPWNNKLQVVKSCLKRPGGGRRES